MVIKIIAGAIAAVGLFYIGGWNIIWDQSLFSNKSFAYNEHGFFLLFNGSYYGAEIVNRFFDSPVISWISLGLGISSLTGGGLFAVYSEGSD